MAGNSANIVSSKPKVVGALAVAPLGTALPTTATAVLDAAYKRGGYLTDAGISVSYDMSSETETAFGGDTVWQGTSGFGQTYSIGLFESLNPVAMEIVYGKDNVTETGGAMTIVTNGKEPDEFVMVLDLIAGARDHRIVVPRAKISNRDEVNYSSSEAVKHQVEITALPDAQGNYSYSYYAAPATP